MRDTTSDHPRGLRILVVDDDPDQALSTAVLLRLVGHVTDYSLGGEDAVRKARWLLPEVVLLDLGMPGLSGYDLAARLRLWPDARFPILVAVTGLGQESDRRRSREAGIDLHLLKPVEPAHLFAVLDRLSRPVRDPPTGCINVRGS